jgi:hypothetical protein
MARPKVDRAGWPKFRESEWKRKFRVVKAG